MLSSFIVSFGKSNRGKESSVISKHRQIMRALLVFSICFSLYIYLVLSIPTKGVDDSTPPEEEGLSETTDIKSSAARVVNGQPVIDKAEYPFVVDLSTHDRAVSSTRFCTGTLVDDYVILTAAHCVLNDGYEKPVFATVGRIELSDNHTDNEHTQTFRTVASIVHPEYRGIGSPNDVAVMLLDGKCDLPKVTLATQSPGKAQEAWVVGYGIQKLGTVQGRPVEVLSGRLQKTALKIMEPDFCSDESLGFKTAPGMLCTAGVKEGSSACRGDSGGGLFVRGGNGMTQVGIVSYGDAKCASEESGVFTDVSAVHDWVIDSLQRLKDAFKPEEIILKQDGPSRIVQLGRVLRPAGLSWKEEVLRAVKLYKILTAYPENREVTASLCDNPGKRDVHLILSNSKHEELVRDKGSCPNNKMSRLAFNASSGAHIIAISGSEEGPFQLEISSRIV